MTFEYKNNMNTGKFTVRTTGIVLPVSKGVTLHHVESKGGYNVYTITKNKLNKFRDMYFDFIPKFSWND